MHEKQCPKCQRDISDSYEPMDESVGIMSSGWYCDYCEEFIIEEWDRFEDDAI